MTRHLIAVLLSLLLVFVSTSAIASGKTYRDRDWNTAFVDTCGLPHRKSLDRTTVDGDRKLQFTLHNGDKGKCSTDNRARHRAPYWERAELSQKTRLKVGRRYTIRAEVTFMSGFTGDREAFFQIHGWTQNCKKADPPVMMKFSQGQLRVEALRGASFLRSGNHQNVVTQAININSLYGKPLLLEVDFDTSTRPGSVTVSLAGRQIVQDEKVDFAICAKPYVKIGVYRPGGQDRGTSVVMFDDVRIEQAN